MDARKTGWLCRESLPIEVKCQVVLTLTGERFCEKSIVVRCLRRVFFDFLKVSPRKRRITQPQSLPCSGIVWISSCGFLKGFGCFSRAICGEKSFAQLQLSHRVIRLYFQCSFE